MVGMVLNLNWQGEQVFWNKWLCFEFISLRLVSSLSKKNVFPWSDLALAKINMVLHAKGTIKSNKRSWTHHHRIRYETSSLGVNIPLMSPRSKDVSKVEMGTSWLLLRQSTIEKQWIGISGGRSWRIGMKLRQWDREVYNASATNLHRDWISGFDSPFTQTMMGSFLFCNACEVQARFDRASMRKKWSN